jgi:hypothetical protein
MAIEKNVNESCTVRGLAQPRSTDYIFNLGIPRIKNDSAWSISQITDGTQENIVGESRFRALKTIERAGMSYISLLLGKKEVGWIKRIFLVEGYRYECQIDRKNYVIVCLYRSLRRVWTIEKGGKPFLTITNVTPTRFLFFTHAFVIHDSLTEKKIGHILPFSRHTNPSIITDPRKWTFGRVFGQLNEKALIFEDGMQNYLSKSEAIMILTLAAEAEGLTRTFL